MFIPKSLDRYIITCRTKYIVSGNRNVNMMWITLLRICLLSRCRASFTVLYRVTLTQLPGKIQVRSHTPLSWEEVRCEVFIPIPREEIIKRNASDIATQSNARTGPNVFSRCISVMPNALCPWPGLKSLVF